MLRKLFLFLVVVLIVIQFLHPAKNNSMNNPNDIATVFPVPDSVQQILKKACNDCHSNYTVYPWYSRVQPVAWWLNNHIEEGKHHLNFSEFAKYTPKKQAHKLHEVAEIIQENEMPLGSYTLIHKEARLSEAEKLLLINWAKNLSVQINPNQTEEKH